MICQHFPMQFYLEIFGRELLHCADCNSYFWADFAGPKTSTIEWVKNGEIIQENSRSAQIGESPGR